jgi:hypothetical protein
VIALLLNDSSAVSLGKNDAGVPVYVNPTLMPNEMANATLDLNMTVGPDQVSVLKKNASNATSLHQQNGVPVYVNPTKMTNEMHNASMDLDMRIGADQVSVLKK